jgi:hypothetical protein
VAGISRPDDDLPGSRRTRTSASVFDAITEIRRATRGKPCSSWRTAGWSARSSAISATASTGSSNLGGRWLDWLADQEGWSLGDRVVLLEDVTVTAPYDLKSRADGSGA